MNNGQTPSSASDAYRLQIVSGDGETVPIDRLGEVEGRLEWRIVGGPVPSESATEHYRRGQSAATDGDVADAIAHFEAAHEAMPGWPQPLFDLAWLHTLMRDPGQALHRYRQVNERVPRGFHHAIRAEAVLSRERTKELPQGTWRELALLEHMDDESGRIAALRDMVERMPTLTQAWHDLARSTAAPKEALSMVERALSLSPDRETRGGLRIRGSIARRDLGRIEEAREQLMRVLQAPDVTFANEAVARIMLAGMPEAG